METFVSAFLIPALHVGRPLEPALPVSSKLIRDSQMIMQLARGWWDYKPVEILGTASEPVRPPSRHGAGVFFSGGADAFHTLLHSGPVSAMIFVHGFDIRLATANDARIARQEEAVRRIAAAKGLKPILVRTSIRAHPLHMVAGWPRTYGGAMAAIGHTLRRELSSVRIASSCELDAPKVTWGTHPTLDHHWGGGLLDVEHCGADLRRFQKIEQIAHDPDAQHSLRVCIQDKDGLNCCRCEKCLRTMIMLKRIGMLEKFASFQPPAPLPELIDALPPGTPVSVKFWAGEFKNDLPPDIAAAARRYEERSLQRHRREAGMLWRGLRKVKRMLGR